ncbi:MAG: hypothetical protein ACLFPD_10260 [Desulfosudaceae bacterium]
MTIAENKARRRPNLVVLASLVLLAAACGRKDLPVPPDAWVPPPPEEIRGEIIGKEAVVTVALPDPDRDGLRVIISRARRPLDGPGACPDCPPDFVRAAAWPVQELEQSASGRRQGVYRQPVKPGNAYRFSAALRSAEGITGPAVKTDSLTVLETGEQ